MSSRAAMTTPNPHRFGSLIFCPQCSSLLDLPGDDDEIICNHCGNVEPASAYENQVITTRSNPSAFPSALRQKHTSLVQAKAVDKKKVYVDEVCEKCGNETMATHSLQMRGVDEGATTFYSCDRCSHSFKVNN